jgi:HAD superfamily hydrolase (TIGR01549 family)
LSILEKYETFIFDLDDTLFDQRDFLAQSIRIFLSQEYPTNSAEQITDLMNLYFAEYQNSGPHQIIQRISKVTGIELNSTKFIEILNNQKIQRRLTLDQGMKKVLKVLRKLDKEIWICTNGSRTQQAIKISLLKKDFDFTQNIIFAIDSELKPSGKSLDLAFPSAESKSKAVMVGDSLSDQIAANSAQIDFLFKWVFSDLILREIGFEE